MIMMLSVVLVLISPISLEAAFKVLPHEKKEIVQKACLCVSCNPWWRPSWLFSARPHPLSQDEKEVVHALYVLSLARVPYGNGALLSPLLALMFEYTGEDIGIATHNTQWVTQSKNRHVFSLNLNSCERRDWPSHSNTLNGNQWETDDKSVVPPHIIFDDGDCQKYYATGAQQCVQFGNLHSGRSMEREYQDPGKGKYAPCFEKISTCGKYKVIIRNDGNYCGGSERAMTVIIQYNIGSVQQRIIGGLQFLEAERRKKIQV